MRAWGPLLVGKLMSFESLRCWAIYVAGSFLKEHSIIFLVLCFIPERRIIITYPLASESS